MDLIPNARNLRTHQTEAEKRLWYNIKNRQLCGYKFRRQHPIPPYIVDFICDESRLIIELDGGQHSPTTDAKRTAFLKNKGYKLIRFWNNDVLSNTESVLEQIMEQLQ